MERPNCQLVGQNGNVFNIIGLVSKALKKAGQTEKAKEFMAKAFKAGSYEEVLQLAEEYVEIE